MYTKMFRTEHLDSERNTFTKCSCRNTLKGLLLIFKHLRVEAGFGF